MRGGLSLTAKAASAHRPVFTTRVRKRHHAAMDTGWGVNMKRLSGRRRLAFAAAWRHGGRLARRRRAPRSWSRSRNRRNHVRERQRRDTTSAGRCRPGVAASARRAASSVRTGWSGAGTRATTTIRRCRTRSSSITAYAIHGTTELPRARRSGVARLRQAASAHAAALFALVRALARQTRIVIFH